MSRTLTDYPRYARELIPPFAAGRYREALPGFVDFLAQHGAKLDGKSQASVRRNILCCYPAVLCDGDIARLPTGQPRPPAWSAFDAQLEAWIGLLGSAEGLNTRAAGNAFECIIACLVPFSADLISDLVELHARLPSADYQRALRRALALAVRAETTNASRQHGYQVAQDLGAAFLHLSEGAPDELRERVAIRNRLADMLVFRGHADPSKMAAQAFALLDASLAEAPGDRFAKELKAHLEQRQATVLQIARFTHDVNTRLGGVRNQLDTLLGDPALPEHLRGVVEALATNIGYVVAVGGVVRGEFGALSLRDPQSILASVLAAHSLPPSCLEVSGPAHAWEIAPGYLELAVGNLVANSLEAYVRRDIAPPERPVTLLLDHHTQTIRIEDRAGGVSASLGDIFRPYVSEKPIRQSTGLGLYQARRAMELQDGGSIVLAPEQPPGGAAFLLTIPR